MKLRSHHFWGLSLLGLLSQPLTAPLLITPLQASDFNSQEWANDSASRSSDDNFNLSGSQNDFNTTSLATDESSSDSEAIEDSDDDTIDMQVENSMALSVVDNQNSGMSLILASNEFKNLSNKGKDIYLELCEVRKNKSPEMALSITPRERELTVQLYAEINKYEYLPDMFKEKSEIEKDEKYINQKATASAYDKRMEILEANYDNQKDSKGKTFKKVYSKKESKIVEVDSPKKYKRLRKKSEKNEDGTRRKQVDIDFDSFSDNDDSNTISIEESGESIEDDLHGFVVPNGFSDEESLNKHVEKNFKREMKRKNANSNKKGKQSTFEPDWDIFEDEDDDDSSKATKSKSVNSNNNNNNNNQPKQQLSPKKSTKRKLESDNDTFGDAAYDDAHPNRIFAQNKIAKITPARSSSKDPAHTNPDINSLKERKIVIYDTETTCITHLCDAQFVEVAAMLVENGIPRKSIHIYLNPNDKKSWEGAEKAHGLGVTFLRPQTRFHKIAKHLQEFFGDEIRCAHNGFAFDDKLLNYEFTRAWMFFHFRKMLQPDVDLSDVLPSTIVFDDAKILAGHEKLKAAGIVKAKGDGPQVNLDQTATALASAAMLYFSKEHMSKDTLRDDKSESGNKAGPMMFQGNRILPDPETHPKHYEAATSRLAWFGLIKVPTDTWTQRQKLNLPHEKMVRDAIITAEFHLRVILDLFQSNILDEDAFREDKIDREKMFDTLYYARENKDVFVRGTTITNLKLDSLLDYYGINRYDREHGNHGAGIDTSLLFQALQSMIGETYPKGTHLWEISKLAQGDQEKYFFKKNSIAEFDEEGKFICATLLHDDMTGRTEFGDPDKKNHVEPVKKPYQPFVKKVVAPVNNTPIIRSSPIQAPIFVNTTPTINPVHVRWPNRPPQFAQGTTHNTTNTNTAMPATLSPSTLKAANGTKEKIVNQ